MHRFMVALALVGCDVTLDVTADDLFEFCTEHPTYLVCNQGAAPTSEAGVPREAGTKSSLAPVGSLRIEWRLPSDPYLLTSMRWPIRQCTRSFWEDGTERFVFFAESPTEMGDRPRGSIALHLNVAGWLDEGEYTPNLEPDTYTWFGCVFHWDDRSMLAQAPEGSIITVEQADDELVVGDFSIPGVCEDGAPEIPCVGSLAGDFSCEPELVIGDP